MKMYSIHTKNMQYIKHKHISVYVTFLSAIHIYAMRCQCKQVLATG